MSIFNNNNQTSKIMKLNKFILKMVGRKILDVLLNDTIYCVVGTFLGVIFGFRYYFQDHTDKAIFWMLCALVCIMNMKESPK